MNWRTQRSGRLKWSTRVAALAAALPLVLAGALTGCGSNSAPSSTGDSADAAASDEYVARSQELVDQAMANAVTGPSAGTVAVDDIVEWTPESSATPSTLPSGALTVAVVYITAVGPPPYMAKIIEQVGEQLGWTVNTLQAATPDAQGALTVMRQAILGQPDAIISMGIPAVWVGPALEEADADDIPTVAVYGNEEFGPGFTGYVGYASGLQKELVAAWVVSDSGGTANTVLVDVPGFEDSEVTAAAAYLEGCGGCTTDEIEVAPDLFFDPIKMQSSISSALATRPDTGYLLWPNGNAALQGTLNGIAKSRAPETQVVFNAAGAQAVQLLQDGTVPIVVQIPDAALTFAAMDQVSRLVQGQPPLTPDQLRLPVGIWTADTPDLDTSYKSMTAEQLSQNDWLAPYEDAWGMSFDDTVLSVTE